MTFGIALAIGAGMGGAALLVFIVTKATGEAFVNFMRGIYLARRHTLPATLQRELDDKAGLPHDARLAAPLMPPPVVFDLEAENRRSQSRFIWDKVFTETVASLAGKNAGIVSPDAMADAATTAQAARNVWEQFREEERERARQPFPAVPPMPPPSVTFTPGGAP